MIFSNLPSISLQTFLKAFVVHGLAFTFFLIIGIKLLKRERTKPNLMLIGFYFSLVAGFFCNFVFVLLSTKPFELIVLILYYTTIYFLLLGTFFLTVFSFFLLNTDKEFSKRFQITLFLLYSLILIGMILIPNGVRINPDTDWNPVYSLPYYLYILSVFIGGSIIPQIFFAIKIFRAFEDSILRKRFICFILGTFFMYFVAFGTITYNLIDDDELRLIFGIISLGLTIFGSLLIYYGIGKSI